VTVSDISLSPTTDRRADFDRWRRRSRLIRRLRVALPVVIGLIFLAMTANVAWRSLVSGPAPTKDTNQPIRLTNPRFVGRDDKGRAFVLTALSATRDPQEYQRVHLDHPNLVLDEQGPDPVRITAHAGIYNENDRLLNVSGGVRLSSSRGAFDTLQSQFDTRTGELVGSGPIQGSGQLGEINAQSYGVYGKGDRMIFKGGVHTRFDQKK
jgi:lipopolysaccharide export system protein LptC